MDYYAMQMDRLHEIAYLHRAEDSHAYRGSLRRTDTMELIYVTYGGLRAQIGDSCFSGERDAVFVLPPQLNLHVSTEVRDTGYLCIGLELQQKGALRSEAQYRAALQYYTSDFAREQMVHLPLFLAPEHGREFYSLFLELYTGYYSSTPGSNLLVKTLAHTLLAKISARTAERTLAVASEAGPETQTATLICQYIREHYTEPLTLEELGEYFHLNPSYLCTMFREKTGHTIIKYLNIQRVEAAKHHLLNPNYTTHEIAQMVGIANEFYFSRLFKQLEGISPSEFRRLYALK